MNLRERWAPAWVVLITLLTHAVAVLVLDALLVMHGDRPAIALLVVDCVVCLCTVAATFLAGFMDFAWRPTPHPLDYGDLEREDNQDVANEREGAMCLFFVMSLLVHFLWFTIGMLIFWGLVFGMNMYSGLHVARFCAGFGFVGFYAALAVAGCLVGCLGAVLWEVWQCLFPVCTCGLCWDTCCNAFCPRWPTAADDAVEDA